MNTQPTPLPAHIRLERWCYPMGRPPVPTTEDKALAAIQVAEDFAGKSDFVRQKALKDYAIANMLRRQAIAAAPVLMAAE